MNELDTKATERSGNTNNWFIKKKNKKKNNGHIVNFFKEKKQKTQSMLVMKGYINYS